MSDILIYRKVSQYDKKLPPTRAVDIGALLDVIMVSENVAIMPQQRGVKRRRCRNITCMSHKYLNLLVLVYVVRLSACNASLSQSRDRTFAHSFGVKHTDGSQRSNSRRWPLRRPINQRNGLDRQLREENNDRVFSAKDKVNEALRNLNPAWVVGTTAAGATLKHIHGNREATKRALFFWTRAGPMVVHYRFTQWWLGATTANRERRDRVYNVLHERYCQPSLDIILHLKGLFVKIGQVLSARPDFVPRQYVELFSTVQDSIPQWPIEQVEDIVREELQSVYGLDWDDVFESMDPIALGSASIGQVHKAVLKSPWDSIDDRYTGGKVVAVKVMHPGAQDRFRHDFQIFKWLCRVALPGWKPILQELERQIMTEFDYRNEAASLQEVRTNMARTEYAKKICIPQPVPPLCSKHMLVMQMLDGKRLSEAIEDKLVAALGGDRKLAHEFLQRKRDGKRHLMKLISPC